MEFLKRASKGLELVFRKLAPNCREASRLQSEGLDHSLSLAQRLSLRLHLLLCKWCRRYGKEIRLLRRVVQERPDQVSEATPGNLSPEARERLKRSLGREPH